MKYVEYGIAGILIGFILMLYIEGCKKDKVIAKKDARIAQLDSIITVFKEHSDTTFIYVKGKDSSSSHVTPIHDSVFIKTGTVIDTTITKGLHSVHVAIDSILTQISLNCRDSVKENYRVDTLKIEIPKLVSVKLPPDPIAWYNTMYSGVGYGAAAILVVLKILGII